MAHELDHSTGSPAFAYVGEEAWHGLGKKLPEGRPIKDWLKAACLEWDLHRLPVQYHFHGISRTMADRFVLVRSDTGGALSIVSGSYNIIQPKEVLEFYRDLVDDFGYTLETAGALDGGRKVWALARTGKVSPIRYPGEDDLAAYVLLATSCDKSLATTAAFTSIRVVCRNTLSFAIHDIETGGRPQIKVPHNLLFEPALVREKLGLFDEAWAGFLAKVRKMADYKISAEDASRFFEKLLILKGKTSLSPKAARDYQSITALLKSAPGQDLHTAQTTLWGAVNAVTYYVDHVRSGTGGEGLNDSWFGAGSSLKDKAWAAASELVSR